MKKVIKFLPALAILLASGLAVATTSKKMAPQYYKSGGEWLPLVGSGIVIGDGPGQHSCQASLDDCTTEGFDQFGNPIDPEEGTLRPN